MTTDPNDVYLARRLLPDGREMTVYAYAFNDRVVIGPPQPAPAWDVGWCYLRGTAVEATADWDGTGEPPGPWIKDLQTGQYGPGMEQL